MFPISWPGTFLPFHELATAAPTAPPLSTGPVICRCHSSLASSCSIPVCAAWGRAAPKAKRPHFEPLSLPSPPLPPLTPQRPPTPVWLVRHCSWWPCGLRARVHLLQGGCAPVRGRPPRRQPPCRHLCSAGCLGQGPAVDQSVSTAVCTACQPLRCLACCVWVSHNSGMHLRLAQYMAAY